MRNSNQFDQIVKNLRSFVDRIRHHPPCHLKLSLWYLGTRENIAELPDFIRLAASIGVREVYLQRLVYFQDDNGYGVANPEKTLMDSDGKSRELVNQSQVWQRRLKACTQILQTDLPGKNVSARKP